MKEVKKVSAALRAVERWEEYLFRRALGVTFIVWAVIVAVMGVISLKAESMASAIGVSSDILMVFTWVPAIIISFGIPAYFFASAGRALKRKLSRGEKIAGVVGWVIWCVLILTGGYLPELFATVAPVIVIAYSAIGVYQLLAAPRALIEEKGPQSR